MTPNERLEIERAMLEVRRASYACGYADGEKKPSGPTVRADNRQQMEDAVKTFDTVLKKHSC